MSMQRHWMKPSVNAEKAMTAQTCAKIILHAAAVRDRECTMSMRGKIGQWLKLIAPKTIDRITKKAAETGR
jgi:hypothetical protein